MEVLEGMIKVEAVVTATTQPTDPPISEIQSRTINLSKPLTMIPVSTMVSHTVKANRSRVMAEIIKVKIKVMVIVKGKDMVIINDRAMITNDKDMVTVTVLARVTAPVLVDKAMKIARNKNQVVEEDQATVQIRCKDLAISQDRAMVTETPKIRVMGVPLTKVMEMAPDLGKTTGKVQEKVTEILRRSKTTMTTTLDKDSEVHKLDKVLVRPNAQATVILRDKAMETVRVTETVRGTATPRVGLVKRGRNLDQGLMVGIKPLISPTTLRHHHVSS